jgi:hypothetical protein
MEARDTMADRPRFPEQYQRINESVEEIAWALDQDYFTPWSEHGANPSPDPRLSPDVHITLNTGKTYRITVDTPDHIKEYMLQTGAKSHFEEGLILVREVSWECIFDAVENLLEDEYYGLDFYALSDKWKA